MVGFGIALGIVVLCYVAILIADFVGNYKCIKRRTAWTITIVIVIIAFIGSLAGLSVAYPERSLLEIVGSSLAMSVLLVSISFVLGISHTSK